MITARLKLGDTRVVLVQPTNDKGAPAEYLKQFGQGFFLLSLATDDVGSQFDLFEQKYQPSKPLNKARLGLENWQVADLPIQAFFGGQLQSTEELKINKT